jgi:hypothetical protein
MSDLLWGVKAFAPVIGRTERAVYHALDRDPNAFPGVKKVAGKWCLCVLVWRRAMYGEDVAPASLPPSPALN